MKHPTVNEAHFINMPCPQLEINTGRAGDSKKARAIGFLEGCNIGKGGRKTQKEKAGS